MEKWITLLSDLCVMIFDLMLYTQMTTLFLYYPGLHLFRPLSA